MIHLNTAKDVFIILCNHKYELYEIKEKMRLSELQMTNRKW